MNAEPRQNTDESLEGARAQPALKPGDRLGSFGIVERIGRGGMGEVYRAHDSRLRRDVAIKVLPPDFAHDAEKLRRFEHEARAASALNHPNIVSVHDVGSVDGVSFIVTELVEGRSLREMLENGALAPRKAVEIAAQIADGLAAAHTAGLVHRDLKAGNVMLTQDELVKILDFGIAKWEVRNDGTTSTLTDTLTKPGEVVGTVTSMSPEQVEGKEVDRRSDIFSLGILLYEMLCGKRPFTGDSRLAVMNAIVSQEPEDLPATVPEAVAGIVRRCLEKLPERRFQSATDLGFALRMTRGAPSGAVERPKARRKKRLMEAPAAVALTVLVLALAALLWAFFKPRATDSIAVLPFENRMHDPNMDYLTEGITESLINDLSRIPTLRVSARGSVFRYDSARVDPQRAGRELQVGRLVRGSVSRWVDELRIEAELIDVRSGARLWGQTYVGKLSSLSDVLEQFSTEVTDQLRLTLTRPLKERLARQYKVRSEPYQDYLKGRFYLNKRTADDFESAVRYFGRAIAKDSTYAPAYAGLAYTYALLAWHASLFGNTAPVHALENARVAAQRALELDGTLAEAYTSLGSVQMQADYQWAAAETTFQRAIQLDQNWADGHESYALELAALGRFDDSEREIKLAEALEPDQWALRAAHATICYYARRYDDSLALLDAIAKDTRADGTLNDLRAPDYWAKSMPAEALEAVLHLPAAFSPDLRTPLLASAYARANQQKNAKELLNAYTARPQTAVWYYLALAHLALGEKAEALRDLERDYERRSAEVPFIAVDPMLDGLRADARFRALLARMRLAAN